MLRTNLATRPFYNIRAVKMALGALAALAILMTLYNAIRVLQLATSQRSLGAEAVAAQNEASQLRSEAARIRAQVDARELEAVTVAAREANAIIDLRAFSWSELFAQLEATLPEDARVTAIQPRVDDDDRFLVELRVETRRIQDLERFLAALEATGTFLNVLATTEQKTSDGLIEAIVEAVYVQSSPNGAAEKPAAPTRTGGAAGD